MRVVGNAKKRHDLYIAAELLPKEEKWVSATPQTLFLLQGVQPDPTNPWPDKNIKISGFRIGVLECLFDQVSIKTLSNYTVGARAVSPGTVVSIKVHNLSDQTLQFGICLEGDEVR